MFPNYVSDLERGLWEQAMEDIEPESENNNNNDNKPGLERYMYNREAADARAQKNLLTVFMKLLPKREANKLKRAVIEEKQATRKAKEAHKARLAEEARAIKFLARNKSAKSKGRKNTRAYTRKAL
jgi:predicted flavoprotein YhiN